MSKPARDRYFAPPQAPPQAPPPPRPATPPLSAVSSPTLSELELGESAASPRRQVMRSVSVLRSQHRAMLKDSLQAAHDAWLRASIDLALDRPISVSVR
ncbi:hypothetical protein HK105_205962 [Polyrhizophydium stewartii]|uniref:Uncharacterized protein n=1 Tax=Polyrhizophydium stewartii TaxID=2732419 RepID=A0ABR4N516_9FUNG